MAINRLFTKTVNTKRLGAVGSSHRETWNANLVDLPCTIHPAGGEQVELTEGGLFKMFKMWCAVDADVQIGDRVVDGSIEYTVKGVAKYDFGSSENVHLSCLLVQGV